MLEKAHALQDRLIAWRRDFHMHPELGFHETRTSGRVAEIAAELGGRVKTSVGRTGVVVELGQGSPVVALRADMDALPLQELNRVDYASQTPGAMHACGHDSHTAMLLGVLALLAKEKFTGTVRALFQPCEETADADGISGAPAMISDGAVEGVDMLLALHVDPALKVGDISIDSGPSSGGVDSWFATLLGKGGHGAHPQDAIDPFTLAAHVIFALNAIPSRRLSPFDPAVVSLGALHGGEAENVIPDRVELKGTLRYMDPAVQKTIHAEIRRALELVKPLGGEYQLRFEIGTPPMLNHTSAVELIRRAGAAVLGPEHVVLPEQGLGAEDFGCFTEKVPGAMFNLGALIEGDQRFGHSPTFDIDERALPIGAAVLAEAVLQFLGKSE